MTNLLDSKSILAKLMATENIHIEQRNVSTASFDVLNRILTVPILNKNISSVQYDLFMGHEVGHALFTPLEGMREGKDQKLNSTVLNILEDVRIERKMKYKYPGLRGSFVKAYKELNDNNFFGIKGVNVQDMNFLDRLNLHTKVGTSLGIKFTPVERDLLKDAESTETYKDVLVVARKVMDYLKEEQEEQKSNKQQNSEDDEDGGFISNIDSKYDDEEYEDFEEEIESVFEETKNESNEEEIRSFTDEAYSNNQDQLFEKSNLQTFYLNVPKFNLKNSVIDYKQYIELLKNDGIEKNVDFNKNFMDIRKETNKAVQYLAKEFQLRKNAEQLKRSSIGKTGDLDMNKIFSYNFSDDIFRKMTIVPEGKSHGLVMYLDWSGSMIDHIQNTVKQLLSLVMFCKKVNIPYDVYCFAQSHKNDPKKHNLKRNDLCPGWFELINLLSSRMSAVEFTYAACALVNMSKNYRNVPGWMRMQNTPLNETIICAMEMVPEFKKRYNLQIVNTVFLTDGQGHTMSYMDSYTHSDSDEQLLRTRDIPYGRDTRRYIVDPVTKNEVMMANNDGSRYSDNISMTECLLKLFKLRTGANVLGFFIVEGRKFRAETSHFFPRSTNFDTLSADFRKNKYVVATAAGYDEFYILRSESMDTRGEDFQVKENVTTRGLVSAFSKYTGGRVTNRVVLNRFIGMIA